MDVWKQWKRKIQKLFMIDKRRGFFPYVSEIHYILGKGMFGRNIPLRRSILYILVKISSLCKNCEI